MTLSSRLWRVIRGKVDARMDLDPDEILREFRRLRSQYAKTEQDRQDKPGARPPANKFTKACARLEIEPTATKQEAKKAWRRLMKKYHPDRHQEDPRKLQIATELSAALTEAYEIFVEAKGE